MQTLKPVTKPSKQRKMLYQAPDHIRHKLFAAPLSPELKATYGVNAVPVRSGDTVRIMRGDHKGFEGKITRVDTRKFRIYVEGLTREKVDGTTILVPIHPSKVMITRLNLDDKWRKKVLERTREIRKKPEETKVKEEVVEEKVAEEAEKPVKRRPRKRKVETAKKSSEKKEKAGKTGEKKLKSERPMAKRKTTKKEKGRSKLG
jgi:large subunit ribosomal protein L24